MTIETLPSSSEETLTHGDVRTKINEVIEAYNAQYIISDGFASYIDATTTTTPITTVAATASQLTNDGSTTASYFPDGVTTLWDTTNNEFDFSELALGDYLHFDADLFLTTSSTNTGYFIELVLGYGGTNQYSVPLARGNIKTVSSDYAISLSRAFYMGQQDFIDYPAIVRITTDIAANVEVGIFIIKVTKRT